MLWNFHPKESSCLRWKRSNRTIITWFKLSVMSLNLVLKIQKWSFSVLYQFIELECFHTRFISCICHISPIDERKMIMFGTLVIQKNYKWYEMPVALIPECRLLSVQLQTGTELSTEYLSTEFLIFLYTFLK